MKDLNKDNPDIPSEVFEKIKKLLALGERGGTEAEATSAMEMAYKLLAKHNLSMEDMEETPIFKTSLQIMPRNSVWQRILYDGICRLYFGQYLVSKKHNGTFHMVIARPENIAMIHHVAQYLINTGERLARESAYMNPSENKTSHMSAFCKGYAFRISERALEQIAKARTEGLAAEKCTAIVVANFYDQEANARASYMQDQKIKSVAARSTYVRSGGNGFSAGKKAGDSVNLNTNKPIK